MWVVVERVERLQCRWWWNAWNAFQWQAPEKEEFDAAISQWATKELNRDGTLKHSYPNDKCLLVPLGHWNQERN